MDSFDKKYAGYENRSISKINDAELNYYIFSITNLGWINCDRFLESKELIDYTIKVPFDRETEVKMVFKDLNGVLMGAESPDGYTFHNVPKGKQVTIRKVN